MFREARSANDRASVVWGTLAGPHTYSSSHSACREAEARADVAWCLGELAERRRGAQDTVENSRAHETAGVGGEDGPKRANLQNEPNFFQIHSIISACINKHALGPPASARRARSGGSTQWRNSRSPEGDRKPVFQDAESHPHW
jgi:hypothetical protein